MGSEAARLSNRCVLAATGEPAWLLRTDGNGMVPAAPRNRTILCVMADAPACFLARVAGFSGLLEIIAARMASVCFRVRVIG